MRVTRIEFSDSPALQSLANCAPLTTIRPELLSCWCRHVFSTQTRQFAFVTFHRFHHGIRRPVQRAPSPGPSPTAQFPFVTFLHFDTLRRGSARWAHPTQTRQFAFVTFHRFHHGIRRPVQCAPSPGPVQPHNSRSSLFVTSTPSGAGRPGGLTPLDHMASAHHFSSPSTSPPWSDHAATAVNKKVQHEPKPHGRRRPRHGRCHNVSREPAA